MAGAAQLVKALGEVNQSVTRLGDQMFSDYQQQALEEAPAKAITLLEESKKQTEKTIEDFVSQRLINEGASPKVRRLTYATIGERRAADEYTNILFGKKNRAVTEVNPANPDDLIDEARKEFLESLGSNIFIREGASGIMLNAEARFRENARNEQDALFENKVRTETGILIQKTIEGYFGDPRASDRDKATGVDYLFSIRDNLRKSGVKNPDAVFLTNVSTAVESMASKSQFMQARELLDSVDARMITDEKGASLGVYGQREDAKSVVARMHVMLDLRERQSEEQDSNEHNKARLRKVSLAKEAAANVVAEAIKNNNLYSPDLETKVREAVEQAVPGSLPGGNGEAHLEGISLLTQYRNASQASNPEALTSYQKAVDVGDMETAQAIVDSPAISAQDRVRLTADFNKAKTFSTIVNAPAVTAAMNNMLGLMRRVSKATDENGQEILDDMTGERSAATSRAIASFRAKVAAEVKATRSKYPDMDNDTFAFTVLPDIVAKHQEAVINQFDTDWKQIEQRQGFGNVEALGGKPITLGAIKIPKASLFGSMSSEKKVEALNAIANAVGNALERSGGELSAFAPESQKMLAELAKKKSEYWPIVQELGKSIAANPTGAENLKITYFNIRNRFGYTTDEILGGVTKEGVQIPLDEWKKRGTAFTSPVFGSYAELVNAVTSYKKLSEQLSAPDLTPEAKTDLEAQEALHPITRLAEALGITNDRAVGAFIKAQEKAVRALAPKEAPKLQTPATAQQPQEEPVYTDAAAAFLKEFNEPDGLDWWSNSNKILENRDNLRQALFTEMAVKFKVEDEQIDSSRFYTKAWKVVKSDIGKYGPMLEALPKEEQDAIYRAALNRVRQAKFSPIQGAKNTP